MHFSLEEINLEEIKQLYFFRGYENEGDDSYCTSLVLLGDNNDDAEFKIALWLSKKTLSITDIKGLLKYLKKAGMKCHADVLKSDFDKFYDARSFKRVKI